MEKKETDCPINDINEDRIENALKQYNEIENSSQCFKNLIMSESRLAGLRGSPSFEKLLKETATCKNVPRGGSEDSRPHKI